MLALADKKVVLIGGGHGTAALAKPLVKICPNVTAVVTVFDSGGHTGEIRASRGVHAFGDIREVISAMADEEKVPTDLLKIWRHRYRYVRGSNLNKRSLGNYNLLALYEIYRGDLAAAVRAACDLLHVRGEVLPVSLTQSHLSVTLEDGCILEGEHGIDELAEDSTDSRKIIHVDLKPEAHVYPPVCQAIMEADLVLACQGSLMGSLSPNLKVKGVAEAIRRTKALFGYIVNLMANKNESPNELASSHAKIVYGLVGRMIDYAFCNDGDISQRAIDRYSAELSHQIVADPDLLTYAHEVILGNFVKEGVRGRVTHNDSLVRMIEKVI